MINVIMYIKYLKWKNTACILCILTIVGWIVSKELSKNTGSIDVVCSLWEWGIYILFPFIQTKFTWSKTKHLMLY